MNNNKVNLNLPIQVRLFKKYIYIRDVVCKYIFKVNVCKKIKKNKSFFFVVLVQILSLYDAVQIQLCNLIKFRANDSKLN
jgi:hypothetical protein